MRQRVVIAIAFLNKALSKRFVKKLDLAVRIAGKLGTGQRDETVHAVDQVSLSVTTGELVGLVGESGCGKSTLGRIIAGLLPPPEGKILFKGRERAPRWAGSEGSAPRSADDTRACALTGSSARRRWCMASWPGLNLADT
jgi:ABC-type oligopeptide transport system ATPase subunit